jgi:hypothetical protein
MKKLALLSTLLTTSLLSASPVIADPSAASGLRTTTEPALGCLLGFEPDGCQGVFFEGRDKWRALGITTYCAQEHVLFGQSDDMRNVGSCGDGPLETVNYLGTNAAGADVYEVDYLHADMTYVIAPPSQDGKIGRFWVRRGRPMQIVPASMVRVASPDAQEMTLYRRPWH